MILAFCVRYNVSWKKQEGRNANNKQENFCNFWEEEYFFNESICFYYRFMELDNNSFTSFEISLTLSIVLCMQIKTDTVLNR